MSRIISGTQLPEDDPFAVMMLGNNDVPIFISEIVDDAERGEAVDYNKDVYKYMVEVMDRRKLYLSYQLGGKSKRVFFNQRNMELIRDLVTGNALLSIERKQGGSEYFTEFLLEEVTNVAIFELS